VPAGTQHTDLLSLQPLPITALQDEVLEALYAPQFMHFNPIQTQIFHTLYHTDGNVLLGAPTGSGARGRAPLGPAQAGPDRARPSVRRLDGGRPPGKTVAAEMAMWRAFRVYPRSKVRPPAVRRGAHELTRARRRRPAPAPDRLHRSAQGAGEGARAGLEPARLPQDWAAPRRAHGRRHAGPAEPAAVSGQGWGRGPDTPLIQVRRRAAHAVARGWGGAASADIIVTTPEKWDSVSRSWQNRDYVRAVSLVCTLGAAVHTAAWPGTDGAVPVAAAPGRVRLGARSSSTRFTCSARTAGRRSR